MYFRRRVPKIVYGVVWSTYFVGPETLYCFDEILSKNETAFRLQSVVKTQTGFKDRILLTVMLLNKLVCVTNRC